MTTADIRRAWLALPLAGAEAMDGRTLVPDATILPDTPMRGFRPDIARFLPAMRACVGAHAFRHGQ